MNDSNKQLFDAHNFILPLAPDVFTAISNGAKEKYNQHVPAEKAAAFLKDVYKECLAGCSYGEQALITRNTKGKWENASLPVQFLMVHKHRGGQPCEEHVRVHFPIGKFNFFPVDIPMFDWEYLVETSELRLAAA